MYGHGTPAKCVSCTLGACLLIAAFIGCGGGDDRDVRGEDILVGVPLSDELRDDLDASRSRLANGIGAATHAAELETYERLNVDIQRPASREAAGDELYALWSADPVNFFWIDLAAGYNYLLRRNEDRNAMYAHPALADADSPVGAYVQGTRFYRYGSRGEHYRRAADSEAGLPPLSGLWLARRLAMIDSDEGRHLEAVRKLLDLVSEAWDIGGAGLALHVWLAVDQSLMRADRLDDALHATSHAMEIAAALGCRYRVVLCRLQQGDILEARREYAAAVSVFKSTAAEATRRDFPWLFTRSMSRAAAVYAELGDPSGALACDLESMNHCLAIADSLNAPRQMMNVSHDFRLIGRLDSALVYQKRARRWVDAFRDKRNRAVLPRLEAEYYCQIGQYDVADSLLTIASGRAKGVGLALDEVELLLALVRQGLEASRPEVAYRALARLENLRDVIRDQWPDQNLRCDLEILTAVFLGRQGEFLPASRALDRARDAIREHGGEAKLWDYHCTAGELALLREDPIAAEDSFTRCLELAGASGWKEKEMTSRFHLGQVLLDNNRNREARGMFAASSSDSAFGGRFRTRISSLLMIGRSYMLEGRPEQAATYLREGLALCTPRSPGDLLSKFHLELGKALAAVGQAADAESHLLDSRRIAAGIIGHEHIAELKNLGWDVRRDVAEALISLYLDQPHLLEGADPGPVTLLLGRGMDLADTGDEALSISFFVGHDQSFRWLVDGDGIRVDILPGRAELSRLVSPVMTDMRAPNRDVSRQAAHRLSAVLLEGAGVLWPVGSLLSISPDDLLHMLPWAALPLPDDRNKGEAASMLLIDHGPLLVLYESEGGPTGRRTATAGAPPTGDLLAIGVDAETADRDEPLPRLRNAEAEARSVAAAWRVGESVLCIGQSAEWTEALAGGLGGFDVIHIASHAIVHRGAPGEATLRLSGAHGSTPLTLSSVRELDLNAGLVYLSCCEAAGGRPRAASGMMDFAGAFLEAGARSVIASTIEVDDASSARLAEKFYDEWQGGSRSPEALRHAMLDLRRESAEWRHPYFWAFYRVISR
jgi:tetratricopeptide (TPR) repeat protein